MSITPNEAILRTRSYLRSAAIFLEWGKGPILPLINEQKAALDAVREIPALKQKSHPYFFSVDEGGQCGVVIEGHLDSCDLASVPMHVVNEILDDLINASDLADVLSRANDAAKRAAFLAAYGEELGEILCRAVDEAFASHSAEHRRFKNWDGTRVFPISDPCDDECYFETVAHDAAHAAPVTVFDYSLAAEDAAALVEERDDAAKRARRGQAVDAA